MAPQTLAIFVLVVCVFCSLALFQRRRIRKRRVRKALSRYIYEKTIDALADDGPEDELTKDGLWINEHEAELMKQYGNQWIAVVRKRVVATARMGGEAWAAAIAKDPSRAPFVSHLSVSGSDF
jgi:hypothetical protein